MKIHKELTQGTDEWLAMRLGKVTASNFSAVLAKGQGKTRATYMIRLCAEILTNQSQPHFKSAAMERGNEVEDQARAMYQLNEAIDTESIGFVEHASGRIGVSPDDFVGQTGLLEIKCPNTTTQIGYVLAGKSPSTYKAQQQGQLWICEREWCDFVSFDDRINGDASYFKVRVYRDEKYIKNLESECFRFIEELDVMVQKCL